MKKLLNVTDLTAYLYCPRKYFLERVKGIRAPANKAMIAGKIRHEVLERFSKSEPVLIESFSKKMECKEITLAYLSFLSRIIDEIFGYNREYLKRFIIPLQELRENIISGMNEEIILRASSVFDAQNRGFLGSQIFENLEPKYFSEFKIESETLGLKGKVDRVMITKESIIPFELKTRPVERIYESDEIQLTAYSMLLEEFFHKQVPTGIIESGNKKQEILIRKEMREKVISLIEEINNLQSPKFPVNFSKCNSCQLKPDCDSISV